MIAIRNPHSGTWQVKQTDYGWAFDLAGGPRRSGSGLHDRFIGDYNLFTGGLTHAHYMRLAPLSSGDVSQLRTAAVSDLCYLPY